MADCAGLEVISAITTKSQSARKNCAWYERSKYIKSSSCCPVHAADGVFGLKFFPLLGGRSIELCRIQFSVGRMAYGSHLKQHKRLSALTDRPSPAAEDHPQADVRRRQGCYLDGLERAQTAKQAGGQPPSTSANARRDGHRSASFYSGSQHPLRHDTTSEKALSNQQLRRSILPQLPGGSSSHIRPRGISISKQTV